MTIASFYKQWGSGDPWGIARQNKDRDGLDILFGRHRDIQLSRIAVSAGMLCGRVEVRFVLQGRARYWSSILARIVGACYASYCIATISKLGEGVASSCIILHCSIFVALDWTLRGKAATLDVKLERDATQVSRTACSGAHCLSSEIGLSINNKDQEVTRCCLQTPIAMLLIGCVRP